MITQAYLKECLDYDPETGVFRWRVRPVEHFPATAKRTSVQIARMWNNRRPGSVAGNPDSHGHIQIEINSKAYAAHQLAWLYVYGVWPSQDLDHRDMVKSNNAIGNLRQATISQNQANRRAYRNNKSGYKGVCYHKLAGRWVAQVNKDGKKVYLGLYDSPEKAREAYVSVAAVLHGEFARFE